MQGRGLLRTLLLLFLGFRVLTFLFTPAGILVLLGMIIFGYVSEPKHQPHEDWLKINDADLVEGDYLVSTPALVDLTFENMYEHSFDATNAECVIDGPNGKWLAHLTPSKDQYSPFGEHQNSGVTIEDVYFEAGVPQSEHHSVQYNIIGRQPRFNGDNSDKLISCKMTDEHYHTAVVWRNNTPNEWVLSKRDIDRFEIKTPVIAATPVQPAVSTDKPVGMFADWKLIVIPPCVGGLLKWLWSMWRSRKAQQT